jgi:glycosyltransferase involved in cell wall biosynthesis
MSLSVAAPTIESVSPRASTSLRVMQVVLSLTAGGTERLVIEIVRSLQRQSVESVVCCLDEEGAWAEEMTRIGVPVIALGRRSGFRPGLGCTIARLAARYRVDVLHCHHYTSFVYGQIAALMKPGLRVVFTEHGRLSDSAPSRKRRLVNPLLGRLPAAIYAVSEDLGRHMVAEGFPAARVQVLHNGIDPGRHTSGEARRLARRTLDLPDAAFVIGTVARLDPVKDLATSLEAFAMLRAHIGGARLVIVGDGLERQSLEEAGDRLGINDAVVWTGHRQDVRSLLPAFDLYVNSSIHEGVSLTILEAMAASIPIVATRVGGNPEVVDLDTGLLVTPRSAADLALALRALASDPIRRRRMGEAARARVKTAFSLDRMVAAYLADYRRLGRGECRTAATV